MGFNWGKIISCINAFTSPKQAINYLLDNIGNKDPKLAQALKQMINENKNPTEVLAQLSSTGQITLQQLAQIKQYYNLARRMGMKQQIPNEEWQKAEQAIRNGLHKPSGSNPTNGRITGF